MKPKLVRLLINDNNFGETLGSYLLVNPDKDKLAELKEMIEHRFDTDGLTDEEIATKEHFCDNIWNIVGSYIKNNFLALEESELFEVYEIEYERG